jgi:protein transport protein SEC24
MALIAVDSAVHFFNLGLNSPEPKSLVVPDLKEIVIPHRVSDLLVSINECRANLESILQKLPTLFAHTQKASVAFGSALNAACNLIAPMGGKVVGLLSSLPNIGEGALQQRDDQKLYGTPKEASLMQPFTNFYKLLATEATKNQVAVDLFLFPSSFIDVASVSCISKYTGGQLFMYPGFNAARAEDAIKFAADFSSFLETEFGMEAVLRIRASQGVTIPSYHGSFFFRSSDLLALPNVARDHSYSAHLSIEDTISGHTVGVQAAFLHTSCNGERRIRVINAAFPVSQDPRDIVQWIDTGATMDLMAKMAVDKVLSGKVEDGKEFLFGKLSEIFTFYRLANGIGQNQQLQVCDSLRALPILVLGVIKSVPHF